MALEKASKTFPGRVAAVRDVSLRVEDGELLALVGPSGSGKTTLLRLERRRELHLLHRRLRATMISVTHNQDEAMSLGERVVVLDRGMVRQGE